VQTSEKTPVGFMTGNPQQPVTIGTCALKIWALNWSKTNRKSTAAGNRVVLWRKTESQGLY
jgi:hypothetical protein